MEKVMFVFLAVVVVAGLGIYTVFSSGDSPPRVICKAVNFTECPKTLGCFWYTGSSSGKRSCVSARPQELCGLYVQGLDKCNSTWKGYEYDTNANKCRERTVQGCEYISPFFSFAVCQQTCVITVPATCGQIPYFSLCKIADKCYWDMEADRCITVDTAFLCSAKVKGEGVCLGFWEGYEYDPDTNTCTPAGASGCSFTAPFYTEEKCRETCVK